MKFRVLFLFFSVLSTFALKAQHYLKAHQNTSFIKPDTTFYLSEPETSTKNTKTTFLNSRTYNLSYHGNNLVNPGINAGISFVFRERIKIKSGTKKNGEKVDRSKKKQLLTSADIGFFWQPESHIGAFNYYEIRLRTIKLKNNSYSIIGLGPGIYRSYYPETFEVEDNGNIDRVPLGGRFYFAPVISIGTGKFKNHGIFHSLSFITNLMFLFDYNSGIVPLLNLEIAFGFDFKKQKIHNE